MLPLSISEFALSVSAFVPDNLSNTGSTSYAGDVLRRRTSALRLSKSIKTTIHNFLQKDFIH